MEKNSVFNAQQMTLDILLSEPKNFDRSIRLAELAQVVQLHVVDALLFE